MNFFFNFMHIWILRVQLENSMNNWPIKQNQKQEQQKDDYFSSEIQNSRSLVTYFTICFRFKQTDNFFSC